MLVIYKLANVHCSAEAHLSLEVSVFIKAVALVSREHVISCSEYKYLQKIHLKCKCYILYYIALLIILLYISLEMLCTWDIISYH